MACAFNYDAHFAEFNKLGRIPVMRARMNVVLHMSDELKNTGKGNLFVVFGEPDGDVLDEGPDGEPGQIRVKVKGVDIFKPSAWQLDTWETYRTVARLGCRTRLPEKQREVLWNIFTKVRSAPNDRGPDRYFNAWSAGRERTGFYFRKHHQFLECFGNYDRRRVKTLRLRGVKNETVGSRPARTSAFRPVGCLWARIARD